jgi:hypothetical protein
MHLAPLRTKLDELDRHINNIWSSAHQKPLPSQASPKLPKEETQATSNLSLLKRLFRMLK